MSGLQAAAVAVSAVALMATVLLALLWARSRRELRELRSTVDELAEQAVAQPDAVYHPEAIGIGDPHVNLTGTGDPHANGYAAPHPDAIVTTDGRTIVIPTTAQVVDATMGRPLVRASLLGYGLRRALRPEHRDRIRAMVRREYHRRRKMRQRAARRAARMAPVHRHDEETYT